VIIVLITALIPLAITPGFLFYIDVTPKVAILLLGVGASLQWFAPARLEGRWIAAPLISPTAFYSRAGHSRQNDFRQTENCLRSAIASPPNRLEPHRMLAQALVAQGHNDQALSEATRATDLNGGNNPEIAAVLEKILEHK
jgi:cytochrome c-type biogenesis protein CcmH/NrfG